MLSNGLRSHGIIEESEEIRMDKESIVLGSGDLYCTDFQGTNEAIPDDTVIETEDNRLGHIKGGAERVRNTFCDLSIKIPRTEISV